MGCSRGCTAQLLTDDELYSAGDAIGDCVDTMAEQMPVAHGAVGVVVKMLALSEKMKKDGAFAWQLKRKLRA